MQQPPSNDICFYAAMEYDANCTTYATIGHYITPTSPVITLTLSGRALITYCENCYEKHIRSKIERMETLTDATKAHILSCYDRIPRMK